MSILPATPATGPERELLAAFQAVRDADEARTKALATYDQALAVVKAQDREEARG